MSDGTVEQRYLVHLSVDGVDLGVWDVWNGGDKDTNSVKYRSGGAPNEESLGGGNTFTDLTISRNYRISRDRGIIGFCLNRCGKGIATAHQTPLNVDWQTAGAPLVAIGRCKTFTYPNVDSNNNNAAIVSMVIEPNSITQT